MPPCPCAFFFIILFFFLNLGLHLILKTIWHLHVKKFMYIFLGDFYQKKFINGPYFSKGFALKKIHEFHCMKKVPTLQCVATWTRLRYASCNISQHATWKRKIVGKKRKKKMKNGEEEEWVFFFNVDTLNFRW